MARNNLVRMCAWLALNLRTNRRSVLKLAVMCASAPALWTGIPLDIDSKNDHRAVERHERRDVITAHNNVLVVPQPDLRLRLRVQITLLPRMDRAKPM